MISRKTELATKFVYRVRRHDRNISIFWLSAPSYLDMVFISRAKLFSEIARVCWLPSDDEQYVREWLSREENGRWLIVLDIKEKLNRHSPEDVRQFIPACSHGSILVITTSPKPILDQVSKSTSREGVSDPFLTFTGLTSSGPNANVTEKEVFIDEMTIAESHALVSMVTRSFDDERIGQLVDFNQPRLPLALINASHEASRSLYKTIFETSLAQITGEEQIRQVPIWSTQENDGKSDTPPSRQSAISHTALELSDNASADADSLLDAIDDREAGPQRRPKTIRIRWGERDDKIALPRTERSYRTLGNKRAGSPHSAAASFLRSFLEEDARPGVDAEGQEVGDGYVLGKQIGYGGHSIIREATHLEAGTFRKVAVKIIRTRNAVPAPEKKRIQAQVEYEIELWRAINHPYLLHLEAVYELDQTWFCFMPLVDGGTLSGVVRTHRQGMDLTHARSYGFQLASALNYLHDRLRVVHCDVCPQNCLIQPSADDGPGQLRLCKFGLARWMDKPPDYNTDVQPQESESAFDHTKGNLDYASPESLSSQKEGKDPIISPCRDVWAYGVCIYTMIVGKPPFQNSFQPRTAMAILAGDWDREPLEEKGGDECSKLVESCLAMDPAQRMDMNDVLICDWICQTDNIRFGEQEVVSLPPSSTNSFRRKDVSSDKSKPTGEWTKGSDSSTGNVAQTSRIGTFGPGQARIGEHPVRQPRGPPYFAELQEKPTSKHEGSKNFARRQRRRAVHDLVHAGGES